MQVTKGCATLAAHFAGIFVAWITHRVLRVPHQNNFAMVH